MVMQKRVPTLSQAEAFLSEAHERNPGPWAMHSRHVALAARLIAERHPLLDPDVAEVVGLLHDIGRREGVTGMRHVLDGYNFLAARVRGCGSHLPDALVCCEASGSHLRRLGLHAR